VLEFFSFNTMRLVKVERETIKTRAYGEEHVVMFIFEK